MNRVLLIAISSVLLAVPACAKKNNWAAQQQQLLLLQQQQAAAAAGQAEAQREQAVRDAYAQQAEANAAKMRAMGQLPGGPAPVPAAAVQLADISGNWNSQLGATTFQLTPNGDGTYSVQGSWDQGWNKRAIFTSGKYVPSARKVAVDYLMPWKNMSGTAEFTVSGSGTEMSGTWHQPDGHGRWSLQRTPGYQVTWLQGKRPRWQQPGAGLKDISGDWNSNLGPVQLDIDRGWNGSYTAKGIWMQAPSGQRIRIRNGVYRPGPAPTLTFDYEQRWTRAQGTAQLTVNPAGTEMRGTFTETGRGAQQWVLSRAAGFVPRNL